MATENRRIPWLVMALLIAQEPALAATVRKPLRPSTYPKKAAAIAATRHAEPIHKARRGGLKKLMAAWRGDASKSGASAQTPAKPGGARVPDSANLEAIDPPATAELELVELAPLKGGERPGPVTPIETYEIPRLPPAAGTSPAAPADAVAQSASGDEHIATIVLDRQGGRVSHLTEDNGKSEAAVAQSPDAAAPTPPHEPVFTGLPDVPVLPAPEHPVAAQSSAFPEVTAGIGAPAAGRSGRNPIRPASPAGPPPKLRPPQAPRPSLAFGAPAPSASLAPSYSSGWRGGYHTVRSGQDLASVAGQYGVAEDAILRYNRLPRTGPLQTGKKVYVPAAGARRVFTATGAAVEAQPAHAPSAPAVATAFAPRPPALSIPVTRVPDAAPRSASAPPAGSPPPEPARTVADARTQVASADDEDDDRGPLDKIKDAISGVFDGFKSLIGRGGRRKPRSPATPATPVVAEAEPAPVVIARPPRDAARPLFAWPVSGMILSRYGPRHGVPHNGIDISSPRGTPIHAAAAGTVIFSSTMRGYGNVVILDHGNRYFSVYAHNQKNLVTRAAGKGRPVQVRAGQTIALVGSTGNAQSPHVHFEIRLENKAVDPMPYLPRGPEAPQASRPVAAAKLTQGRG